MLAAVAVVLDHQQEEQRHQEELVAEALVEQELKMVLMDQPIVVEEEVAEAIKTLPLLKELEEQEVAELSSLDTLELKLLQEAS